MGNTKVKDLKSGMVLASHVFNIAGQVLLPKGTVLSDATIQMLKRREIAVVETEAPKNEAPGLPSPLPQPPDPSAEVIEPIEPPAPKPTLAPLSPTQVEERVKFLFRHTDLHHPLMQALYQESLKKHLHQNIAREETP